VTPRPSTCDQHSPSAVRRGDGRAFEELYERFRRPIANVLGMVGHHGRAEDVTQEVVISELRRMWDTGRPVAFKPWVYEIAKNACIDHFRRSRRAEEVPLETDEGGCRTPIAAR
jgi:RNA polymerase sigma factor (sigma-70 family)